MASFLVLWDVDFTLVNASGVGRYLYRLAFAELYGRELPARANEANMAGRTDRAIALDVLALADVPDPPGRVSEFEAALARLAPSLAELVATTAKALPGAAEALAALAALTGTNPGCDQSRSARKPAGPGVPQPDPSPASNGPACHSPASHSPSPS
ncbi:MAG TPA: hypothetical protein VN840_06035, partial [Streptosporangiaceae bacterium]|nr:hypothetical protein [Streptosporangiaceae bacterium]